MTLSTWRQYQIPQFKGYRNAPTPGPTSDTVTSPGCYLFFRPNGYKSEVPKTPYISLTNLQEWLTLLDYWFIIKDVTQQQSDERGEV